MGRGHAGAVALPHRPPDHVPRGGGGPAHGARRLSGRQEQYVRQPAWPPPARLGGLVAGWAQFGYILHKKLAKLAPFTMSCEV